MQNTFINPVFHRVYNLDLDSTICNLRRKRHVLLLVVNAENKAVTCRKNGFYPEGITRLPGGGVNENETYEEAAIREAEEELSIKFKPEELKKIAEIQINAKTPDGDFKLDTEMFYVKTDQEPKPGDDVDGFEYLNMSELGVLADKYESFLPDDVYISGDYKHYWKDYGKIYGPIHRIASEYMLDGGELVTKYY